MKILIVTPIFPPEIGGPATYVKEFAKRATAQGNKVTIITLSDVKNDELKDIKIISIRRSGNKIRRHSALLSAIFSQAIKHDLIYAQNPGAIGLPCALVSRIARKPLVVKFVGDTAWEKAFREGKTEKLLEDFLTNPDANENILKIERFVFKTATKVITPSNFLAMILTKHHKVPISKINVINNAVDVFGIKPKRINEKENALITVARLVPWKGINELISLMPQINKLSGAKLWVVGEGPYEDELKKKAHGMAYVKFLGTLEHEKLLSKISSARILILNSLYEGLPHVLIESLAVGTPIVATNICGNPEVVEDGKTGLLVPPRSSNDLRSAISEILLDPNKQIKFAQEGFKKSKKYSWENLMNETLPVLKGVV